MNNSKSSRIYTISDLAKEFDLTTRSIRHYEEQGLITPERDGMQRIYYPRDRVRLQLILRGKRIGFSLAEIREIIDMYQLPEGEQKQAELLLRKIKERREVLHAQKQDIDQMLNELERLEMKMQTEKV